MDNERHALDHQSLSLVEVAKLHRKEHGDIAKAIMREARMEEAKEFLRDIIFKTDAVGTVDCKISISKPQ